MAVAVSPFAAPAVLAVAAAALAGLPASASRAARILLPGACVLAAALAAFGTRPAPDVAADALARLLFVLLAAVVAALSLAAALSPTQAIAAGGRRLRFARAGIPAAGAAALLAATLADAAASLGALAVLALAGAVLGAIVPGAEAARDAVRRLVLVSVAASVGWLGLLLVAAGSTGPGALMLLVAAGALGAAPAIVGGVSQAAARLPAPLAGAMLLLPPIAAAAPLLRARAALPAGSGAARLADALLILAGLVSLAVGAAGAAPRGADARIIAPRIIAPRIITARIITARIITARIITALWGPALFGWGLGSAAGLQAGFAALVAAAVAGFALLEAAPCGAGPARTASLLAAASLPPFGGFAALMLLAEAALPTRPVLGVVFLVVLGAFSLAVLGAFSLAALQARDTAEAAGSPPLLVAALAVSVLLGVAMPAPIADALVDAAGLVAGGGS